jgi:hypothetical protein
MPQIQQLRKDLRPSGPRMVHRGNEHGDLPVDDPPPADHPSERYSAWSATSIFNFVPFSAPSGPPDGR